MTDPSQEPGSPNRAAGAAYQGAVEAVLSVVVAIGLGYWADEHFQSSPIGVITGAVIGFASMTLRLVRLGRHLNPPPEDDSARDTNE